MADRTFMNDIAAGGILKKHYVDSQANAVYRVLKVDKPDLEVEWFGLDGRRIDNLPTVRNIGLCYNDVVPSEEVFDKILTPLEKTLDMIGYISGVSNVVKRGGKPIIAESLTEAVIRLKAQKDKQK